VNRFKITPRLALALSTIVAFLAFAVTASLLLKQAWMGVELGVDNGKIRVEYVHPNGPSATVLYMGDIIAQIGGVDGPMLALGERDIMQDPNELATYAAYRLFMRKQEQLAKILSQPTIQLALDDGRVVRIQPSRERPLVSLPWSFWLNHFFAFLALLISTGVWSVRKRASTHLLLFSGFGFFLAAVFSSPYISRELALSPDIFHFASEANNIGTRIFSICGIGLLWSYPRNLSRFPMFPVLLLLEGVYVVNNIFQWQQPPLHAFTFDLPLLALLAMGLGIWRWRQTSNNPLDRAIVKWFLISIFPSIGLVLALFVVPLFLSSQSLLPVSGSYLLLLIIYCGLALGVIKYRLFDIDRWWLDVWLWFFAGVAIVAFDLILVTLAGTAPSHAIGLSVIIAAWIYFPLRQKLWSRFYRTQRGLEEYVPLLVRHFIQAEQSGTTRVWRQVLNEVFRPLSIETRQRQASKVDIVEDGIRLIVPCLRGDCCVELYYAEKGRRLFNRIDASLASALFNISKSSMEQRESYTKAITEERKRIMRDLHDDVGGCLLTLAHSGQNEYAAMAARSLKSLREIIYSLDNEQNMTLNEAIAKWRIEAFERCEARNIDFEWNWEEVAHDIELSPRHALNLTLVLREALSNIVKHSDSSRVRFSFRVAEGNLHVIIGNDNVTLQENGSNSGKGLQNMRFRTEELGGSFESGCQDGSFFVRLTIPNLESAESA
jgi:signal transduction histidine kinase